MLIFRKFPRFYSPIVRDMIAIENSYKAQLMRIDTPHLLYRMKKRNLKHNDFDDGLTDNRIPNPWVFVA